MTRRDVAQNRRRFGQSPIAIGEHRHARFRIKPHEVRAVLLIGGKIDARKLVALAGFFERDVRRERAGAGRVVEFQQAFLNYPTRVVASVSEAIQRGRSWIASSLPLPAMTR